ncbi:MAG: NigD-like protein [Prevotellaceae bacterium]|nr:NigD-like protein [Prevotellaceae bacterium]MDY5210789.1 NigD-like protein [Prevotella sp.]
MKRIKTLMLLMVVALTAVSLQSCDDDDDDNYPGFNLATVTLKAPTVDGGKWFMQLDDSTALEATNIASHPYGNKELRAYIRYNDIKDMTNAPTSRSTIKKMYSVNVLTIDTILTKKMDPMVDNMAEVYGNDPVEVIDSWETVAEDGYLNIRFRTRWGNNIKHRVTLVHRTDVNNPYTVEFIHNAHGDINGHVADGMVAFRLDDCFNKGDEPIEITLKWKSYSGEETAKFKYIPRKD